MDCPDSKSPVCSRRANRYNQRIRQTPIADDFGRYEEPEMFYHLYSVDAYLVFIPSTYDGIYGILQAIKYRQASRVGYELFKGCYVPSGISMQEKIKLLGMVRTK